MTDISYDTTSGVFYDDYGNVLPAGQVADLLAQGANIYDISLPAASSQASSTAIYSPTAPVASHQPTSIVTVPVPTGPVSSAIAPTPTPAGVTPLSSQTLEQFVKANGTLLAIAGVGLVAMLLIKGKRR